MFGPETPTGKFKHAASITELAGGDLYLVFYSGASEYAGDTAVYGARFRKSESRWSEARLIAKDPFHPLGNAVVWQAPDGPVWLFYVVRCGEGWGTSRIHAKISEDGAGTWSDSTVLAFAEGTMVRNRPIVRERH